MNRNIRRAGCLIVGLFWTGLFLITILGTTMGDCFSEEPEKSQCEHARTINQRKWLGGELLLLVGIGWIFYRLELKNGEF
ncbi:MAG: hypothetical protein ACJ8EY_07630 [Sphingomicrobium sp.]